MKILLIGSQGQLGWELNRCLPTAGQVIALNRAKVDLSQPQQLRGAIHSVAPDIIFNAAAYTAVDKAQSNEHAAGLINAEAVAVMADEAQRCRALLVHYSTDYVFDGTKATPYEESDATNPLNVYGRTKLAGEDAIRSSGAAHLILRTSWVYAARGSNFLLTMLRLMREREYLSVVADQYGAPTWARSIAEASAQIAAALQPGIDQPDGDFASGTYHMTCQGATSWHGFATAIATKARQCKYLPPLRIREIQAVSTTDYGSPTPRPRSSLMATRALRERFHLELPPWQDALSACMLEIDAEAIRARQVAFCCG